MAVTFDTFAHPAPGGNVVISLLGDPVLKIDDVIRFFGYGSYHITGIQYQTPQSGYYYAQLLNRDAGSPNTIPIGTHVSTYSESLQHDRLAYTAVTYVSFKGPSYQSMVLEGDLNLAAQGHAPARSVAIRLINTGATSRNLTFPASWTFLGGRPTVLLGNKVGVLSITCFGPGSVDFLPDTIASDADVIAAWSTN